MYQSFVYLDVRVLLSAVPGVFIEDSSVSEKKDILTAKKTFQERNNHKKVPSSVMIQTRALHKVSAFVQATGGTIVDEAVLEKLTGNIQEPPDDKNFTGFSVKVAEGGSLNIGFHQKSKSIKIEEIRIEEDCGHLTRAGGKAKMDWTYAGCPIMRLKTSASFELGEEAELFLDELYSLLSYLNLIVNENDENCIRSNAYVSLAEYPDVPDYSVKLRNLNSSNFVRKAINNELSRQEAILSGGGKIVSESRLWMEEQNSTQLFHSRIDNVVQFEKITPEVKIEVAKFAGPSAIDVELPAQRRLRLQKQYGIPLRNSTFICSRKDFADYFEFAVKAGAKSILTAHWMESELIHLLERDNKTLLSSNLTPQKFADVMKLLDSGAINSSIAKFLMEQVLNSEKEVDELVKESGKVLITSEEELLPYVKQVLDENKESIKLLQKGELAPLEYLTGCVMKLTDGCASPLIVKSLIKNELKISIVYILTMGGGITGERKADGNVRAGEALAIKKLLGKTASEFPLQVIPVRSMLSEEIEPNDWAHLISEVASKIESGTANGIVITHGTDTLPYTAALLFWLFNSSNVPVVLTSSSSLPSESDEAEKNLNLAVKTAREKKKGVYVAFGGKVLSALNLKFMSFTKDGFENWNLKAPETLSEHFISRQFLSMPAPETEVLESLLNEAAKHFAVVKIMPGLLGSRLAHVVDAENDVHTVIAELYACGTGNMRNSDYSLKPLLTAGHKNDCKFYCTSQQKCSVDFSRYSTSMRMWREGVVPMGLLTTESVVALYFAAYLIADNDEELADLMETTAEACVLFN